MRRGQLDVLLSFNIKNAPSLLFLSDARYLFCTQSEQKILRASFYGRPDIFLISRFRRVGGGMGARAFFPILEISEKNPRGGFSKNRAFFGAAGREGVGGMAKGG